MGVSNDGSQLSGSLKARLEGVGANRKNKKKKKRKWWRLMAAARTDPMRSIAIRCDAIRCIGRRQNDGCLGPFSRPDRATRSPLFSVFGSVSLSLSLSFSLVNCTSTSGHLLERKDQQPKCWLYLPLLPLNRLLYSHCIPFFFLSSFSDRI